MKAHRSFLIELETFYRAAWPAIDRAGENYEEIVASIFRIARKIGGLMPDYVRFILSNSPLFIYLMRGRFSDEISLESLKEKFTDLRIPDKLRIIGAWDLLLEVVGMTSTPSGKGGWMYAYFPEYSRFLVIRVNFKNPLEFSQRIRFRKVRIKANKGSLFVIPAVNKGYRNNLKLSFSIVDEIKHLPHINPEELLLLRQGLITPNLLVETAVPTRSGELVPGLGFITIVKNANVVNRFGNIIRVQVDRQLLTLDSSYAPLSEEGDSSIFLLFLTPGNVDGYYLGKLQCEHQEHHFDYYIPSNLFIETLGKDIAFMIRDLTNDLLKYYEPIDERDAAEYKRLRIEFNLKRRDALKMFYEKHDKRKHKIPNPSLIFEYREALTWLQGIRRISNLSLSKQSINVNLN